MYNIMRGKLLLVDATLFEDTSNVRKTLKYKYYTHTHTHVIIYNPLVVSILPQYGE